MRSEAVWSELGFKIYCIFFLLFMLGFLLLATLHSTEGKLIYSLDDPYIHLAMAESILAGNYGINLDEYASPSSSIAYPFVLAALLKAGFGDLSPLIVSIPATMWSTWLVAGTVWSGLRGLRTEHLSLSFILTGPVLVFLLNSVALPMTGMEHSLHVLGSVLVLKGLLLLHPDTGRTGILCIAAGILIVATMRFEGLALAAFTIMVLFYRQKLFSAISISSVLMTVFFGYAYMMGCYGLPVLPSSVLMKSDIALQASDARLPEVVVSLIRNFIRSLSDRWGLVIGLSVIILMVGLIKNKAASIQHRDVFLVAILTLSAHLFAGRYGWFGRYEVYAVAVTVMALATLISDLTFKTSQRSLLIATTVCLWILAIPYVYITMISPAASRNIFEQHYQMHRFSKSFFPYPVAVNDLGWVSYQNDIYVLDLWGLGSEEARQINAADGWTQQSLREITSRHNVAYAMIYDSWFDQVPVEWCPIATLRTSHVTSASAVVTFYLIRRELHDKMKSRLREFAVTLPRGAEMLLLDCAEPT